MKNILFYTKLFFSLLTDRKNYDSLNFIIDDSASHVINKNIIRNIATIFLFLKKEVVIYQGKKPKIIYNIKSLNKYLDNFDRKNVEFKLEKYLNLLPNKSYKIIYSDFYLTDNDNKIIDENYDGMLIANNYKFIPKDIKSKKIHKIK